MGEDRAGYGCYRDVDYAWDYLLGVDLRGCKAGDGGGCGVFIVEVLV